MERSAVSVTRISREISCLVPAPAESQRVQMLLRFSGARGALFSARRLSCCLPFGRRCGQPFRQTARIFHLPWHSKLLKVGEGVGRFHYREFLVSAFMLETRDR